MKKYLFTGFTLICSLALISWGTTGHRAVATIAENHLTPATKLAIHKILGAESLADVSNYADEIRSSPAFKYTGAWHYVNVPSGYTYSQFETEIKSMREENVYKALITFVSILKNPNKSKVEKAFALKFLVHIVGDLHQPMHVSNAEDKGW